MSDQLIFCAAAVMSSEAVLLRHLGEEFDLRSWCNVHGRLGELDAAYRLSLQLRPGA
jgi:hypothetical protein